MKWTTDKFTEHPEGGRFREVFRSSIPVHREDQPERTACTHIYFHLRAGEVSRFHKVEQEEIWNLYTGGLRLWIYDENTGSLEEHLLSPEKNCFCTVVPAGAWQAAEPLTEEVLVGCTVAPGFDFEDFELIQENTDCVHILRNLGLERFL